MEDYPKFDTTKIETRDDFVRFVEWLHKDFQVNTAAWDNDNLRSFLSGVVGTSQDVGGHYRTVGIQIDPDVPSWRVFADILYGATIYE